MNTTIRSSRLRRAALWFCTLTLSACAFAAEPVTVIPAPAVDNPKAAGPLQTAVLAGGCFWGVQGVYQHVRGVAQGAVRLCGRRQGERASTKPSVSGRTGHAESVQIVFDPQQVSYGELLQIYFSVAHDPTAAQSPGS